MKLTISVDYSIPGKILVSGSSEEDPDNFASIKDEGLPTNLDKKNIKERTIQYVGMVASKLYRNYLDKNT